MKVRYAAELSVAFSTGAMPEAGGVVDQEAPFADALAIIADSQASEIRRRAQGGR